MTAITIKPLKVIGEAVFSDLNDDRNDEDALAAALTDTKAAAYTSYFVGRLLQAARREACETEDAEVVRAECELAISQARQAAVTVALHGEAALEGPRALDADDAAFAERIRRPAVARIVARFAAEYARTGDLADLYRLRTVASDLAAGIHQEA